MKEISRFKVKNGWVLVNVDYLDVSEIILDNEEWSYLSPAKNKIPTLDISLSRRKAHREKLKNRSQRFASDYLLLTKILSSVKSWIENEKPKYLYVGAIKDEILNKRISFYIRFLNRCGYKSLDDNFALVNCVDDSLSVYWMMVRNV